MKMAKSVHAFANVTLFSLAVIGLYSGLKLREACNEIKASGNDVIRRISKALDQSETNRDML
jgi:hypothetical protein